MGRGVRLAAVDRLVIDQVGTSRQWMGRPGVVRAASLPVAGAARSRYCTLFGTNRPEEHRRRFGTRRDVPCDFALGTWVRLVA